MKKNTRNNRHTPRNPEKPDDSLKILNLGLCLEASCGDQSPEEDHYHGLAYTTNTSDPELIDRALKTLRGIGFTGSVEVEHISQNEWKKRAAGYSDWL